MKLTFSDILRFRKIDYVEYYYVDCKILIVYYTDGNFVKYGKVKKWCELHPFLRSVSRSVNKKLDKLYELAESNGCKVFDCKRVNVKLRIKKND